MGITYAIDHSKLESKLDNLASLVKEIGQQSWTVSKLCGICISTDHPTDAFPTLYETGRENY